MLIQAIALTLEAKPAGRQPWFLTASQALIGHLGPGSHAAGKRNDASSFKSGTSQQRFRSMSKDSNQELDAVIVEPPREAKTAKR